jgi:hypothetical protein
MRPPFETCDVVRAAFPAARAVCRLLGRELVARVGLKESAFAAAEGTDRGPLHFSNFEPRPERFLRRAFRPLAHDKPAMGDVQNKPADHVAAALRARRFIDFRHTELRLESS